MRKCAGAPTDHRDVLSLISAEPLVQQIVGQVITAVSQLTARMLSVQPTVEVGQSPALGEDGAGQVWPPVVEIPRIVTQSDISRGRRASQTWALGCLWESSSCCRGSCCCSRQWTPTSFSPRENLAWRSWSCSLPCSGNISTSDLRSRPSLGVWNTSRLKTPSLHNYGWWYQDDII